MNLKLKILLVLILLSSCIKKNFEVDILIKNGTVYNGIDTIPKTVLIAIKNDRIVFIGKDSELNFKANKVIDDSGLIVSSGFIDPHTHADRDLKDATKSHNQPFLFQGITTVVTGNDGLKSGGKDSLYIR